MVLAGPGLVAAGTDFGDFDRQIGKSAVTDVERPKASCVCQDGSSVHGRAGRLIRVTVPTSINGDFFAAVAVVCAVPGFDSGLVEVTSASCQTFPALPR